MDEHIPLVSIGIPVYNGEAFLRQCLDSILHQTFQDFEIIIADNASTDQTEAICQEYAAQDQRIRYHRNAQNLGAARNYDLTFELSRGQYFKWAAHDDLIAPTYLERCVEVLEQDSSVVLCHSITALIDGEGHEIPFDVERDCFVDREGHAFRKLDRPRNFDSAAPHVRYGEVLTGTRWCFEVFGLVRSELFRRSSKHGAYYGSDKVLLSELSLVGRFVLLPEPLFFNRRHSNQSASLATARAREIWISPKKTKKFVSPRLLCTSGYLRAIFWADLTVFERVWCLLVFGSWLVRLDNWQRVWMDIVRGLPMGKGANLPASPPATSPVISVEEG